MLTLFGRPRAASAPALGDDVAVRCQNVEKGFGSGETRVRVLRGTDFEARTGEMTFLVGPSGCGKTTLISILGGLLTAESGDVQVLGTDLRKLRGGGLVDFRLANIGFIFQQFNLLPTLTAAENAAVALLARGESRRKSVQRASELLGRLGLDEHRHKYPNQLSGGQQQRVAIARALAHEPRLVISDEPTASLDAESGQAVMTLLRELALQPDRAVIVVTHDNRIFSYADRIVHMADGTVTHVETPTNTSDQEPE